MRGKVIADVFKIVSWLRLITFHNNLLCQISSHDVTEIKNEKLPGNTSDETEITEYWRGERSRWLCPHSSPTQIYLSCLLTSLLDQYQYQCCFVFLLRYDILCSRVTLPSHCKWVNKCHKKSLCVDCMKGEQNRIK